jgi:hypothetical protein
LFHVYHHCSGEVWGKHRSELDAILASFELLVPGKGGEEPAPEGREEAAAEGREDAPDGATQEGAGPAGE